jgi:hypothetical protein
MSDNTLANIVSDQVLLTWFIGQITKQHRIVSDARIAAMFYLAEKELAKENIFNPSYNFFRYKSRVFSRKLYRDLCSFSDSPIIRINDAACEVTSLGLNVTDYIETQLIKDKSWNKVLLVLKQKLQLFIDPETLVEGCNEGEYLIKEPAGGLILPEGVIESFFKIFG